MAARRISAEERRAALMANPEFYPTHVQDEPTSQKGVFGPVRGIELFQIFRDRAECVRSRVHVRNYAGISGHATYGAFSIVLSGGYRDDEDRGDIIVYTGTGGHTKDDDGSVGKSWGNTGPHDCDQTFDHPDNYALKVSVQTRRPVRVIRGANAKSKYAPGQGYRYDGLYTVEGAYLDKGVDGYMVCKYTLRRNDGQPPIPLQQPSA